MILGLDTSRWSDNPKTQKTIDWNKAKENGVRFVIMKATEGNFLKDTVYLLHKEALNGLLPRGSYHYLRTTSKAYHQAKYYYEFAGDLELPPCIDLEDWYKELPTGLKLRQLTYDMMVATEDFFGRECILYTAPNIVKGYLQLQSNLDCKFTKEILKRKVWMAHYDAKTPDVRPWKDYAYWQFSGNGDGNKYGLNEAKGVDVNWYNGNEQDFCKEFGINYDRFFSGSPINTDPKPTDPPTPPATPVEPPKTKKVFTSPSSRIVRTRPTVESVADNNDSILPNKEYEVLEIININKTGTEVWVKIGENKYVCQQLADVNERKFFDIKDKK